MVPVTDGRGALGRGTEAGGDGRRTRVQPDPTVSHGARITPPHQSHFEARGPVLLMPVSQSVIGYMRPSWWQGGVKNYLAETNFLEKGQLAPIGN